jgi:2-amino-4-hydroxy-6-hydroxymethyldihydropteridine diphosphokinase
MTMTKPANESRPSDPHVIAFIGLGSNMERRERYLQRAVAALGERDDMEVLAESSVYETEPVGYTEQPAFLNMVIAVRTALPPRRLLDVMLGIERSLGRTRTIRWGPRTIDLDLLLYGETHVSEPDLTVPHPRMHERAFVLVPLLEVMGGTFSSHRLRESFARQLETLDGKEGVVLWRKSTSRSASERSAN